MYVLESKRHKKKMHFGPLPLYRKPSDTCRLTHQQAVFLERVTEENKPEPCVRRLFRLRHFHGRRLARCDLSETGRF
jgi:hypothetical protein